MTEIAKLGQILGELNFRPFFEQVTSSRSSGESLGTDLFPGDKRSKKCRVLWGSLICNIWSLKPLQMGWEEDLREKVFFFFNGCTRDMWQV